MNCSYITKKIVLKLIIIGNRKTEYTCKRTLLLLSATLQILKKYSDISKVAIQLGEYLLLFLALLSSIKYNNNVGIMESPHI